MIRIGVCGAGAWGRNHIRVAASEAGCTLAAIADPDPAARAQASAIAPNARLVADPDQLIADSEIDALIIASPAPTHAALASSALAAGKHVLIEKPLALSLDDASMVAAHAATSTKVVMVGHLMVHHPAVTRMRELLRSGELGQLHYVHATRVNRGRLRREESVLWSFGPHDLSMIDALLERDPTSVAARGISIAHTDVEDVVFMTLRYATGEMAHIHLSRVSARKERRLVLVGSHKVAEFDDVSADKLHVYASGYDTPPAFTEYAQFLSLRGGDVHIPRLDMDEPLRLQLRHFLACIVERRQPITDLASGVRVTTVLEAAQRSLTLDGAPVDIPNSR